MDFFYIILSISTGAAILYFGGDVLVENSRRLGLRLKIDPMVIGLTIVAFGTSAPELFVSAQGALLGKTDLALGNVVGSNITNILLILGLSSIINPIKIVKRTYLKDIPIVVAVSVLLLILSLDLNISRIDGIILLFFFATYTILEIKQAKKNKNLVTTDESIEILSTSSSKKEILLITASLLGLMLGSTIFIYGATKIALMFGISELVIGLTIVSVGTSLPEIVTSCVAAKRGENEIAVGNIIGSNIFNILSVMGITSLLYPVPVPLAALSFDMPIMIFSALACFPVVMTDLKIKRSEGILFLLFYIAYVTYLILISKEQANIPVVSEITLAFILPLALFYFKNLKVKKA